MKKLLLGLLAGSIANLLSSCVVYMPMQCAAPQINGKKQAEITGSSYLNGRFDAAGTYSPVPHLLVRAAYSNLRDKSRDSTYYRGHQYDLGLGTYWQVSPHLLVGGLGGIGQARGEAAYSTGSFDSLYGRSRKYGFDVRYNKLFGEIYGIYQPNDVFSVGASYRVTQANFTTLTDVGRPIDLSGMTRSEPMFFWRARLGDGPAATRPVQLQIAIGMSTTFGYDSSRPNGADRSVEELKQGRGYTTVSVSIFPHCLFRKAPAIEAN